MGSTSLNALWLLLCSGLIALMQAGFLCLETGFTRGKNNINVAVKNVADLGASALCFWLVGYAIMFGDASNIAFDLEANFVEVAFFFFQLMFCGTAVTIISGGTAERLSFRGYLLIAFVTAALIYPVFGHWAWYGLGAGNLTGWLGRRGFVDFAGSTVVHSIGGWSCLALLLILGPRANRYDETTGVTRKIIGANLPFAALGVLILWVGWLGFNGGSTLEFNEQVPRILVNTALGGTAGMFAAMIASQLYTGQVTAESFLNGPLAGLVSVTASVHSISPLEALIIGFIGGLVAYIVELVLIRNRIDDAVGAIPVHLGAGIWGTLAVGIFGNPEQLDTGLGWSEQILVQLLGIAVAFAWAFCVPYLLYTLLNRLSPLRVPPEAEQIGLNVYEHDARTDILDMFMVMDQQAQTGDLSLRVPEEEFTEVGQIAQKYNDVLGNLEQTVARVQSIVETAQDGILTFAPTTWQIQSANPAASSILLMPANALMKHSFRDFIVGKVSSPDILMGHGVLKFVEMTGRRGDGSEFPMEIVVSKVETGEALYYSAIFRDITERQTYINELSEARDAAMQANRLKDQLLAMVGHELRTPIMSISGSAELIETGALGEVNESQKQFLSQIVDSTFHLNILVNDLIQQSHLETGRVTLNPHPFEIRPFMENATHGLYRQAADKNITFDYHIADSMPAEICNDSTRLQQVIINLVINSIKFTPEGSVSLVLHKSSDTHWMLTVQDTGVGIPAEKQNEIFKPFRQVQDVTTRENGGFGLGLAIVSQLVTLMQGTIHLESEPNQGTTIQITLPIDISVH